MQNLLRELPKVDELLQDSKIRSWIPKLSHKIVVISLREAIDRVRTKILNGQIISDVEHEVILNFNNIVEKSQIKSLRRVLNGTGIVLHTNLGRARLAQAARDQVEEVASAYSTLEYSLEQRKRGTRYSHVVELLKKLTGAEDALVVNNNAAAVLLALNTMAKGKEAIVSRGQLIEIGGSFRIPAVMEQSGCFLREIGTTNKTHLDDYEQAVSEDTAVFLKVHTSNYRILGFTKEVSTQELVELGKKYQIPLLEDLGSGMFFDTSKLGLSYEPTVPEVVAAGADIVTFSGDKLLGGPQAGIIVGNARYVEAMRNNHLNRALRIDKLTLAALEATLKLYLDEEIALRDIPTLRMLSCTKEELWARAKALKSRLLNEIADLVFVSVVETTGQVGGGALPLAEIPSAGLLISPRRLSINKYEERLRLARTPLIARIENDGLLVDLRTINVDEEQELISLLTQALVEG